MLTLRQRALSTAGATSSAVNIGASAPVAIQNADGLSRELERERIRRKARRIVDAEERGPSPSPPEIITLRDLIAEPDPAALWRIKGWLPAGGRAVMAAQMKAGKTTIVGALTRSLVDGDLFLGRAEVSAFSGNVAIIDTEMSRGQLRSWLRVQGIRNDDRVVLLPLRGKASTFDILDDAGRARWAGWLLEHEVAFLILDCLRPVLDALGLDEHRDAGRFLVALDGLLRDAAIAEAIVVHHMGHGEERSRGDSRLRDWPDVEIRVVRQSAEPSSPRFISAYGRDVDVRETQLTFDPQTRRVSVSEGSRRDFATRGARDAILACLRESEQPLTYRKLEEGARRKGDHTVGAIRAALAGAIRANEILVEDGPKRSKLHSLPSSAPSASECAAPASTHINSEGVSVRHRPKGRRTTRTRKEVCEHGQQSSPSPGLEGASPSGAEPAER